MSGLSRITNGMLCDNITIVRRVSPIEVSISETTKKVNVVLDQIKKINIKMRRIC